MPTLAELYQQTQNGLPGLPSSSAPNRLPNVALGLGQIVQNSGKLAKGTRMVGRDDGQAQYLFSQQGINTRQLNTSLADLQNLSSTSAAAPQWAPPLPLADTDVDGYLTLRKETIIIAAMEECRQQCQQDVQETLRKRMVDDWRAMRGKIMEELGGFADNQGGEYSGQGSSSRNGGSLASSSGYPSDPHFAAGSAESVMKMHTKMMKYDEIIRTLNDYRKEKRHFALMSYMSHKITTGTDKKSERLPQMFDLILHLLHERETNPELGQFAGVPISERQYAKDYLSGEAQLGERVVFGGKNWLEQSFMEQLEKVLRDRPQEAKLGGQPGATNKIRAFVSILEKDGNYKNVLENINGNPFWAQVYFLLRTGHPDEARELVESTEFAMHRRDKNFVAWFKTWIEDPNRRLTKEQRDALLSEWKSSVRVLLDRNVNGDPFKFALYKLIGRVDLSKKLVRGVTETTDDWMWLQLSLVREAPHPGESASERYTLKDLGKIVTKLGEKHYDPSKKEPLEFFAQLLLTGQFERAVAFLHSKSAFNVDAVHIGIALAYYGLIRVPPKAATSETEILTSVPAPHDSEHTIDYLNFSRMIQRYIRMFVKTDTADALQYVYLIGLNGDAPGGVGAEQNEICRKLIGDVIMETKSYQLLIGEDGVENSSVIGKDLPLINVADSQEFIASLVREAADRPTADLPTHVLVKLFTLADDLDRVMLVLNKELSESMAKALTPEELRHPDPLRAQVVEVVQRLETQGKKLPLQAKSTCENLIYLRDAQRAKALGQNQETLELIQRTDLLPLDKDVPGITRAAEQCKFLDSLIMRNMDRILIMVMSSLFEVHSEHKKAAFGGDARQHNMQLLRKKSRALMMFAGMLRFKMSSDTYAQLAKLDAFF